ncbi:MAG: glycerate kinase [Verrucomicrobia bacterium]|nr:glycerate kinase [Verrucomicrobiota bacterium]
MAANILVIPDKFKGTLSAQAAADAIAVGWKKARPNDLIQLLPMSDGGDGFGEIVASAIGARPQQIKTVNAAHEKIESTWWWESRSQTAIIESANVIGLAMLPTGKFHPFQLDTFGLGKTLEAAARKGARSCYMGIGGSATNDAGFGMARALGWKFLDQTGAEITDWTNLAQLEKIVAPVNRILFPNLIVAVDVTNPLLGKTGCSQIYGPQKGLRREDCPKAEAALKRLVAVSRETFKCDFCKIPGAGAAGGLGFGLMAFLDARPQSGFGIFAQNARLKEHLRKADLVITGEGALDQQTLMGKGVGQIALLCKEYKVRCIGLAGIVTEPEKAKKLFAQTRGLVEITSDTNAKKQPAKYLCKLAEDVASNWEV